MDFLNNWRMMAAIMVAIVVVIGLHLGLLIWFVRRLGKQNRDDDVRSKRRATPPEDF